MQQTGTFGPGGKPPIQRCGSGINPDVVITPIECSASGSVLADVGAISRRLARIRQRSNIDKGQRWLSISTSVYPSASCRETNKLVYRRMSGRCTRYANGTTGFGSRVLESKDSGASAAVRNSP